MVLYLAPDGPGRWLGGVKGQELFDCLQVHPPSQQLQGPESPDKHLVSSWSACLPFLFVYFFWSPYE